MQTERLIKYHGKDMYESGGTPGAKVANPDYNYLPENVQGILCTSWREVRRFLMGKSCLGALGMGGGAERSTRGAPRASSA